MKLVTITVVTVLFTYLGLAFMASNALSPETAYQVLMSIKAQSMATASDIDVIDEAFGAVAEGYDLDHSEKCNLLTDKTAALVEACNNLEK